MKGLMVLSLVTVALLLSHFGALEGATYYHEAAELRGSMARYRQFYEHEDTVTSMRHSLQVEMEQIVGRLAEENSAENVEVEQIRTAEQLQEEERKESTEARKENSAKNLEAGQKGTAGQLQEEKRKEGKEAREENSAGNVAVEQKGTAEQLQEEKRKEGKDARRENSGENVEVEQKGATEQEEERKEGNEARKGEGSKSEKEIAFVLPEPYWLGPKIDDWDEQRGDWLEQNPHMKLPEGKPKVLIITGSQPKPCISTVGDFFHIQSLKLKIDYARMHNYEVYYNFAWLDPLFDGFWAKIPIIRKLMLTHPEIEWFLWMDSDAIFTDMLFEVPFHTYVGYNMVMWGSSEGVYEKKIWTDFNDGVFFLRNCQWSLDLIDKWALMGPSGPTREAYGKLLSSVLVGRDHLFDGYYPADDQSALHYLLLTDEAVKAKVKLVDLAEYTLSGWWVATVPLYTEAVEKYHPGFGDNRWPFVTHFTGCGPCGGNQGTDHFKKCMQSFELAYNFADNQVLAFMGFEHISPSALNVTRNRNESGRALEFVDMNPWEERIAQVAASEINIQR